VLLDSVDSDADASVVIVLRQCSYETTQETLANSHRSLGMRPQQD